MNQTFEQQRAIPVVHRLQIEIGWKSLFRVLVALLLVYCAILLWPVFKMLILATLLAIALNPIVVWVQRKGGPHWLGLLTAASALVLLVAGCFGMIAPLVFRQLAALPATLPHLREQLMAQLPAAGVLRHIVEQGLSSGTVADSRLMLERLVVLLGTTVAALVYMVVVIAIAVYLLSEGSRALRWLIVFFPPRERERISQALVQISRLTSSYVGGQFMVSALAALYLFLVLSALGVPMALLLGVIAGICDVVPIVGFFIAVFIAMIMGLTLSPTTALLIFVFYGAYHLFENFFIIPRIYGRKLRLSKLAVPLAIAAGGVLAGVIGAIAVLPIVAAYPVIERLWLTSKLEPDALKAHEWSSS